MFPQDGWSIGRFGGIEIKLNISVLLITFIVTFSLATRVLPAFAPGYGVVVYWLVAALGAVLFAVSILWHELAHSLMAIRYGIPVIQIVLHLFGGVAQIARDPERPSQEFWIAIVGPISSAVLFGFFGLIAGMRGVVGALCGWMAVVNLSLALFNLLPGFPLDGGRVLRAALWRISGSYRKATRQASRVGQVMAGAFALFGLYSLFGTGDAFNGLWFLMIAAFLFSAASAMYRMAAGDSLPMDTPIRRVMRFNVPQVDSQTPLAILAWKYLDHARDQAFPVFENGLLVGLISAMQVDKIPRLEWGKYRVNELMLPRDKLRVVSPFDTISTALAALEEAGMDHAPVFERDQFVGMLNRRDIVYRT